MYVDYYSNNSGGDWWLDDKDWLALEKAGWEVDWIKNRKDGRSAPDENGRWLGTLATSATRCGLRLREAMEEWECLTGQSSTEAGCPCCGPPHYFTEYTDEDKYVASGPSVSYEVRWE